MDNKPLPTYGSHGIGELISRQKEAHIGQGKRFASSAIYNVVVNKAVDTFWDVSREAFSTSGRQSPNAQELMVIAGLFQLTESQTRELHALAGLEYPARPDRDGKLPMGLAEAKGWVNNAILQTLSPQPQVVEATAPSPRPTTTEKTATAITQSRPQPTTSPLSPTGSDKLLPKPSVELVARLVAEGKLKPETPPQTTAPAEEPASGSKQVITDPEQYRHRRQYVSGESPHPAILPPQSPYRFTRLIIDNNKKPPSPAKE